MSGSRDELMFLFVTSPLTTRVCHALFVAVLVEVRVEIQSSDSLLRHSIEAEIISQWGSGPPDSRDVGLLALMNTMLAASNGIVTRSTSPAPTVTVGDVAGTSVAVEAQIEAVGKGEA